MILRPRADATALILTSVVLQRLHDEMPTDQFTLGRLVQSLHKRSFGIIMLILALVAFTPGLSIVAGVLLKISRVPDDRGNARPGFPTLHRYALPAGETPCRCGAAIRANA